MTKNSNKNHLSHTSFKLTIFKIFIAISPLNNDQKIKKTKFSKCKTNVTFQDYCRVVFLKVKPMEHKKYEKRKIVDEASAYVHGFIFYN